MKLQNKADWIQRLNEVGTQHTPAFFIIDYKTQNAEIIPIDECDQNEIYFEFRTQKHAPKIVQNPILEELEFSPLSEKSFKNQFDIVANHLQSGDSYLVNLTFSTPLKNKLDLAQIFLQAKAKYKVLYRDEWVCFSPETFIEIRENTLYTYPMKGTINAEIPDAKNVLLNDPKETAEHFTIVDLLRNDISQIAKNVKVTKFRFIDKIQTQKGEILQASSEIKGDLPQNWQNQLGDILAKLLPAGSICGAPKKKTLDIIAEAETYERGYYTGICGYFSGDALDTGVMIRFIEKTGNSYFYKSGGGITAQSNWHKEYQEIYQKIYLPI
ncbi:aminodeoxychorismate synthase component I [Ornithobacterium rhinotracheale]|uniref:aminodeoxychorismate synthase component I n=1 Tax=Ornithobacterium rhinotracheale TaxID=28251 RepID=UPI00129C9588|nr:aminodeoxychorismate synthase component I [Ornithobacterium rhinotracheale]MRJ07923.1 aminodeoxychorismate synthase component I [Ornithobacterium rhinotracheale]UOH78565.1 aminodeoxychorismate synthase component I [Ornithobacterium rhinotracheale]